MSINFQHRTSRKREQSTWKENALLLTMAGSIIAVIGQLSGRFYTRIIFGPQDASDFSINIDPISNMTFVNESANMSVKVTANDFHSLLRHYRFKIFFYVHLVHQKTCASNSIHLK